MTKAVDAIQRPKQLGSEPKRPRPKETQKKARAASKDAARARATASFARQQPARTKLYLAVGISFLVVLGIWAMTFRWNGKGTGENLFQTIADRFQEVFSSDKARENTFENGTVKGTTEELQQLKEQVFPQFTENGQ